MLAAQQNKDAARDTPEAKQARSASRTRYRSESADEALATTRAEHGDFLLAPALQGLHLGDGQSVRRYLSDFSALVANPSTQSDTFVESTMPLRTQGGNREPVDLRLRDDGDFFSPRSPLAQARIPKHLEAGVDLPGAGLSLHPLGMAGDGTEVADKLFYPNAIAGGDADALVQPVAGGVEFALQLRSEASPEEFRFRIDLPAGAELKPDAAGHGGLEVVRGDTLLARITPAFAFDADGTRVPVDRYEVNGAEVTLRVRHRDADIRYPVLVDPQIVEAFPWNSGGSDGNGWSINDHSAGRVTYFLGGGWLGTGLYVETLSAQTFYSSDWGAWAFWAPGNTYISRADGSGVRLDSPDGHSCIFQGLWETVGGYYAGPLWQSCTTVAPGDHTYCVSSGCPAVPATTEHNAFVDAAQFNATWFSNGWDTFTGGVTLYEQDNAPPPVTGITHTGLPSGWVDSAAPSVRLDGYDLGLGMKSFKLDVPGSSLRVRSFSCSGDRNSRCPIATQNPNNGGITNWTYSDDPGVSGSSFTYPTTSMPEGIDTVRAWTEDAVGNAGPVRTWPIKIDHSAPKITPEGSLFDKRGQTVDDGVYHLRVNATDGTGSVPASGVHDITVSVDGTTEGTAVQSPTCTSDSCPLSLDYEFATLAHLPGTHTIAITSTDQLGHSAAYPPFTVTVADPTSCQSAFVDPGATQPLSLDLSGPCSGSLPPPPIDGCNYPGTPFYLLCPHR